MTVTLRTASGGIRPEFEHPTANRRQGISSGMGSQAIRFRSVAPCTQVTVPTTVPFDVRGWRLEWNDAQYGQWRQLRDVWDATLGGVIPMTYTPVGEADIDAVQVTFVPNSFEWTRTGLVTYTMSVEVEELR